MTYIHNGVMLTGDEAEAAFAAAISRPLQEMQRLCWEDYLHEDALAALAGAPLLPVDANGVYLLKQGYLWK